MTFESTFKNTNRNTISNIMWQSIPDSGGRVFIAARGWNSSHVADREKVMRWWPQIATRSVHG